MGGREHQPRDPPPPRPARARRRFGNEAPLRGRLSRVLATLTVADARAVYAAIRLAEPGGLGQVEEQDVREEPTVTLREAMALAAERDTIAREYVTDYDVTFGSGRPGSAAGPRGRPRLAGGGARELPSRAGRGSGHAHRAQARDPRPRVP